jgi:hypothetical protein
MTKQSRQISKAAALLAVFIRATVAFADTDAYKPLSAEWWQWALSVPADQNPLLDSTGADCMIGQRGTTWFLGGTFYPLASPVTRACSIPEGITLFFPVANTVGMDTPGACGQGDPLPSSFYRQANADFISGVTNMSVTLDGNSAGPIHHSASPVFAVALPADSVFVPFCPPDSLPVGIYSPSVDEGYYVRLNPLSVGVHTLRIRAENPTAGFAQDVTYNLRVVPIVSK